MIDKNDLTPEQKEEIIKQALSEKPLESLKKELGFIEVGEFYTAPSYERFKKHLDESGDEECSDEDAVFLYFAYLNAGGLRLNYSKLGRSLLQVDELPQGALARYERDVAAIARIKEKDDLSAGESDE